MAAVARRNCGFYFNLRQVEELQEYKTLKGIGQGEYEEHRSRFIGNAFPVKTEKECIDLIAKIKQENFGARHNVYAYVLKDNNICRYSDDSEPHSTAGLPTLDVIKKNGLVDVLIVTTRYFGGVLLGTGGLVRAYTAAAKAAVEDAGIAVMHECYICSINCSYSDYQILEQLLTDMGANLLGNEFTDEVKIGFSIETSLYEKLAEKLKDRFCGRITPEIESTRFAEV